MDSTTSGSTTCGGRRRLTVGVTITVLLAALLAPTTAAAASDDSQAGDNTRTVNAITATTERTVAAAPTVAARTITTTGSGPVARDTTQTIRLAAGDSHTCGVHLDGTVSCWGSNALNAPLDDDPDGTELVGQSRAPDGTFTDIATGSRTTCGLRADQTVECWGWLDAAPAEEFTQVAAAARNACALRADGSVTCWGWDTSFYGSFDTFGPYTQIGISSERLCGLLLDGTLECTSNGTPEATPTGTFTSLSVSEGDHSCAVRVDQTVACWGNNSHGQTDAPTGTFIEVSAGTLHTCGLRTDGTVTCWGDTGDGRSDPPAGAFITVSAGDNHSCAARTDATVTCWGSDRHQGTPVGKVRVPTAGYHAFAATATQRCGLLHDDTVACWNLDEQGPGPVIAGTYTSLVGNGAQMCGVRTDDTIACWDTAGTQIMPLAGTFESLAVSWAHGCAVTTAAAIECWGGTGLDEELAPAGTFTQVAVDQGISCGLATDGTVECWGNEELTSPPGGTFTHIAVGEAAACGIRPDNSVECWGDGAPSLALAGDFTRLAMTFDLLCGIDTDEHLACDGQGRWAGEQVPPPGSFTQLTGDSPPCALRTDGAHQCWGDRHVVWGPPFVATEPAPASITGTVTGPDGALDDVVVAAYAPDDGWAPTALTATTGDGSYSIDDLDPGTYAVVFVPPAASGLVVQWYDASSTRATATPVQVSAGATVAGIDATVASGTTITGTVTGPDGPVEHAVVWAFSPTDSWVGSHVAATDANGSYTLEGVEPGTYAVRVVGPAGGGLQARWYDGSTSRVGATPVVATLGTPTTDIDVNLPAAASISGTVTGPDGPLEGALVWAYATTDGWVGSGASFTDATGGYHIGGLGSATYTVVVVPPAASGLSPLWYPNTASRGTATTFALTAPAGATGIDLAYPPPAT